MITRPHRRYESIIKTLLRTQTTKLRIKSERRRFYHELAYDVHGPPWSSIKYYQSTDPHHHHHHHSNNTSPPNNFLAHDRWVQVEMIAAPYNPADALGIQGKYPNPYTRSHNHYNIGNNNNNSSSNNNVTNPFEKVAKWSRSRRKLVNDDHTEIVGTVPGSEGWGRIINVQRQTSGNSNSNTDTRMPNQDTLQIGDYVVMGQPGLGTYRSSLWLPSTSLVKLQRGPELFEKYGPTTPAPLFQTAGTALRMLRDYISPLPTTTISSSTHDSASPTIAIVQNAGNSAVGLMVSQIATKIMNYQCISNIRSNQRTAIEMDELQQYMMEYGNPTRILTQESLDLDVDEPTPNHGIRNIRLGLNAVGGDSIRTLLRMMMSKDSNRNGHSATLVTYGNMSKQSYFSIDPSQLIFQNLNVTGFWYSQWMVQQQYLFHASCSNINNETIDVKPLDVRSLMMNEIVDAVLHRSLKCPPVQAYPLCDFKLAFEQTNMQKNIKPKVVFDCRQ